MAKRMKVEAVITARDQASAPIGRVESRFKGLASTISKSKVKIVAALAGIAVAFQQLQRAADLKGQTAALRTQLAQQGQDLDTYLLKLQEVSRGTISTADLIGASSRALLLGIPAEKISELLETARASAIATGQSVSTAFNDITTGIGRASPLILDNLGLMVNLTETYGQAAESIGIAAEEMTQTQKSAALLNAVLDIGRQRVAQYGEAQDLVSSQMQRANATLVNLKNEMFNFGNRVVLFLTSQLYGLYSIMALLNAGVDTFRIEIHKLSSALNPFISRNEKWLAQMTLQRDRFREIAEESRKTGKDLLSAALSTEKLEQQTRVLSSTSESARARLKELAGQVGANTEETARLYEVTLDASSGFRDQVQQQNALIASTQRLITTKRDFIAVERELGRAAAERAAIQSGAVGEGGRLRLPGGSRRLIRGGAGSTPFQFSGGKFVFIDGRRAQVFPDGRVVFP